MSARSKNFVFTNWALDTDYTKYIGAGVEYIAYSVEIGEDKSGPTHGVHHQGWLCMENSRRHSAIPKIAKQLGISKLIPMKGSILDSDVYISKQSSITELGKRPQPGRRYDLEALTREVYDGKTTVDEIVINDPEMYHKYGRTLAKTEDLALRKRWRTEMTKGIWYWGQTGTGKSHKAFEGTTPADTYVKCLKDQWWDGYAGQPTVIMNEFRGEIPFGELLSLVDKWPHTVKRRCREPVPFLAKRLIITSSMPPKDVYYNIATEDSLDQLKRRFDIIEMPRR